MSVSGVRSEIIFNNHLSILSKYTHRVRLFSNLSAENPAAGISTSEAKMHQDRIIHIRNKKHDLKDKTSILENTHLDFTVVCL